MSKLNKLVFCNHKSYLKSKQADKYIKDLGEVPDRVVIFPTIAYLEKFAEAGYSLGSQNVGPYNIKALTGEVNASQLVELGVKYCLVGHYERRKYAYEDNKQINRKIKLLIKKMIIPVLCIGEAQKEYDEGVTSAVIKKQLDTALNDIEDLDPKEIIFAYEPVWAIGSGKHPSNSDILKAIAFIKKELKDKYKNQYSVIYGGSVTKDNLESLNKIDMLDGYLVGSSSSKVEDLKYIIEHTE